MEAPRTPAPMTMTSYDVRSAMGSTVGTARDRWQRQMTRIRRLWCTLCRMEDDLQAVAEALASRLHRAVAIDDPRMHLLVHTAHHGPVDPARMESILRLQPPDEVTRYARSLGIAKADRPVRVPAREDLQLLSRVVAPLRADGLLVGYLWIIDEDEALTVQEMAVVEDSARAAAEILRRRVLALDAKGARAQQLAQALLDGDRSGAAPLREEELWTADRVQVLRAEPTAPVTREALVRATRDGGRHRCLVAATSPVALVLVPPSADVGALATNLCAATGAAWCTVGSVVALEEAAQSAEEAERAARVARSVPPGGPLVEWERLGVYRLLVHLPLERLPAGAVPPQLLPLLESDSGRDLVRTVETYLDSAGDARTTVAALNVHRTSLYYRLGRFTELTGLDLNDGEQRLQVHLGLKLLRLLS